MAGRKAECKTGHSSDQWFKLKTKHQNNDEKTSRGEPTKQRKKEGRKQSGQASKFENERQNDEQRR